MTEFTELLESAGSGHSESAEKLLNEVYTELRSLASARMANEAAGHTLQPTALVHEAWIHLVGDSEQQFADRKHFFAASAEAMRRILIDSARRKARLRRGGRMNKVSLEHVTLAVEDSDDMVLAIHEALDRLAESSALKAEIVKMRYFVGMKHAEIAEALGISEVTVRRHWAYSRSWLYAELKQAE